MPSVTASSPAITEMSTVEIPTIKDAVASTPKIRIKRVAVKKIGGRRPPAFER